MIYRETPDPHTYLGDGVYASFDGYMIALHIGGHDTEPVVYLDPEVSAALVAYRAKCIGAAEHSSSHTSGGSDG